MADLFARDLPVWPPGNPGDVNDTIIGGVHFNVSTLNYWNYTLYEGNWTLSNWSRCYLVDQPYTPPLLLNNGTFGTVSSPPLCSQGASLTCVNSISQQHMVLPCHPAQRSPREHWSWFRRRIRLMFSLCPGQPNSPWKALPARRKEVLPYREEMAVVLGHLHLR